MTLRIEPELSVVRRERFDRLLPVVRGMAQRMRPADEDMVASGVATLWELLWENPKESNRYFVAAVRNAMIDHCRYRNVRRREKRIAEVCGLQEGVARRETPEVDVEDLLALLPRRMRCAFEWHCLRSHTIAETARKLDTSIRTVARLVALARNRLRRELT